MKTDAIDPNIHKEYLLEQYHKKRAEVEQKMRPRQKNLSEEAFQSLVSIATADSFQELQKQGVDQLTNLITKVEFMRRLSSAMNFVNRNGGSLKVYTIDLDNFKEVNDNKGHEAGDEVLKKIGQWLKESVRVYDTVSRLGGDEFGVIQVNLPESGNDTIANRLSKNIHDNSEKTTGMGIISASIGCADFTKKDSLNPADLLDRSDIAVSNAKNITGTNIVNWIPGMVRQERVLKGR